MNISNSPIRPERSVKPHHVRHLISGTIVFALGVLFNMAHTHLVTHRTVVVYWLGPEVQVETNYVITSTRIKPPFPKGVQVGVTEEGTIVGRQQK